MTDDPQQQDSDLDLENRRLCADGACIGVVGTDGRCRICGRPAGDATDDAIGARAWAPPPDEDEPPEPAAANAEDGAPEADDASDDDEDRELCSDGGCIGVLGADGRCKVCGKPRGWTEPTGGEPAAGAPQRGR